MRLALLLLLFTVSVQAETTEEAYKRLFPRGAIVLWVHPKIENSSIVVLKALNMMNSFSPNLKQHYIHYEIFLASMRRGTLLINKTFEGREYLVFGSKVFMMENGRVKYILSKNLRVVSDRQLNYLSVARKTKIRVESLVQPFLSCSQTL